MFSHSLCIHSYIVVSLPMFRIDAAGEFSVAISSGQDSATREERRETVCDSVSDPRNDQMEDVVDRHRTVFS